jgi:TRAP-type C4-dicarboxylate transport system substrate-binding protein
MKKHIFTLTWALILCLTLVLTPLTPLAADVCFAADDPALARPMSADVLIDGESIAFDAYNINDNNYFKLRDLAYALNGTEKQFEVGYDTATKAITLTSGKAYTSVGGEMQGKGADNKTPVLTSSKIILDGNAASFTAYNIGGNNYFKLRDVGQAFDFGVDWDCARRTIAISTNKGYATEGFNFVFQNPGPEDSVYGKYIEDWCAAVTEASGGRIGFTIFNDGVLFGAYESAEAVRYGAADICWLETRFSGQFPISEFLQLPLNGNSCSRVGSKAVTEMFEVSPELRAEYEDFKVIQVSSGVPAPIGTTTKKLETVADLQGLKIRIPGVSVCADWAAAVGMMPVTMTISDTYEALEKYVIDGCISDWYGIGALELTDLTRYIMDWTLPGSANAVLMNKDSYNSLPDDLKRVVDEHSMSYASDMAGIYLDSTRAETLKQAEESGVEIYKASDELVNKFNSVKDEVHKQYIDSLNERGLDGQKIYDQFTEIMDKYNAEYDDTWDDPVMTDDF